jgi:hypothetical protein
MFRILRTAAPSMLAESRARLRAFALAACTLTACSGAGQFVWFTDLPPDMASALVVHPGDTVSVRVLGHVEMSVKV